MSALLESPLSRPLSLHMTVCELCTAHGTLDKFRLAPSNPQRWSSALNRQQSQFYPAWAVKYGYVKYRAHPNLHSQVHPQRAEEAVSGWSPG